MPVCAAGDGAAGATVFRSSSVCDICIALFALAILAFILINSNVIGLICRFVDAGGDSELLYRVMALTLPAMYSDVHIRYSALAAAFNISVLITV